MNYQIYDKEYFEHKLKKSKYSRLLKGERIWYRFWLKRYLNGALNNGGKILEVGCGLGFLAKYLETESIFKIIGLDISEYAIQMARNHSPRSYFLVASVEKL